MGKKKEEEDDEEEEEEDDEEEEEEDDTGYVTKFTGCVKVDNPCKICLQSVDYGTGLQCQGACDAWVHFECLNYTPGKISDIQGGLITVTCPCPDCKTTIPREFLTEAPFACNNVSCPANNPPSCEEPTCQANELTRRRPAKCPPPNTLRQCSEALCQAYSTSPSSYPTPVEDPCMEGHTLKTYCGDMAGQGNTAPLPANMGARGGGAMQNDVMQQMCKTVGDLAKELNSLLANLQGNQGGAQGGGGGIRGCKGGITCGKIEQGGMKPCGSTGSSCGGQAGCKKCGGPPPATNKKQCTGGCGHAGEVKCSQPCHCPGNPVKNVKKI